MDLPMPQIMEELGVAVQPAQSERIRDQSMEQIPVVPRSNRGADFCGSPDHEESCVLHPGSDRGASAPDHGENCG